MAGQQGQPKSSASSLTPENRILTQALTAKENFNLSAEKKRTEKAEINYNYRRGIKPKQQNKAAGKESSLASTSSSALPQTNVTRISESMDHATTSNNEQTLTTQSNAIPAPTPASTKKTRVPPIILRDKNAYSELIRILTFQGIQFGSTQTKPEGVAFFPPTPDDHRMMINVLNDRKYGYYTFCPPEKQHLRTIIKGVLESISTDEGTQDNSRPAGLSTTTQTRSSLAKYSPEHLQIIKETIFDPW
ncbi:hypothetical protein GWI33_023168 [Rhynchophorus ferrugineus]|uniref:Uncharacterized protein n=1 Tax=Rhynchophorus ferrugineus TaxID=354439 RepID=A0A834HLN2_RHYFE|nr:hypothetical protein GWI33_023168 [Rhynchophorus ferrugineus]